MQHERLFLPGTTEVRVKHLAGLARPRPGRR
jgi:hypothetical protein